MTGILCVIDFTAIALWLVYIILLLLSEQMIMLHVDIACTNDNLKQNPMLKIAINV